MEIKLLDYNGKFIGIFNIKKAIEKARLLNMDLIRINKHSDPKIYKIGNFKKYIFDKKKNTKKQKQRKIKEIKFKTNICDSDYLTKLKKILFFIKKRISTKIIINIIGRNINKDIFIKKVEEDISKYFVLKKSIKFVNNNIIFYIESGILKDKKK
ncbi:translation initiation factor IF-3 [Candidatus Vidania fulgoroideorum]